MLLPKRTSAPPSRPRTTPVSRNSSRKTSTGQHLPELLEFEWPDLPPVDLIKDALTRNTVSRGIAYLLPVDKSKASVESRYRTDLRAIFQDPYLGQAREFKEDQLVRNSKIQFRNNIPTARWTGYAKSGVSVNINADSEKWRQLYLHSAPTSAVRLDESAASEEDKYRRSNRVLPIKTPIPPEAMKMRKEAEKVLQSARDEEGDYDTNSEMKKADDTSIHKSSRENQRDIDRRRVEEIIRQRVTQNHPLPSPHIKEIKVFTTYSDIKGTKAPKLLIPDTFRSEFLTLEQNQDIWNWLHYGEELTDFEYFLSVCG